MHKILFSLGGIGRMHVCRLIIIIRHSRCDNNYYYRVIMFYDIVIVVVVVVVDVDVYGRTNRFRV